MAAENLKRMSIFSGSFCDFGAKKKRHSAKTMNETLLFDDVRQNGMSLNSQSHVMGQATKPPTKW